MGWYPCCCGDSGGGTTPPDADGCCKCIEVTINGFPDVNCAYSAYLNGTYRVAYDGAGTAGFSGCPIPFGQNICTYSTTFQILEVENYDYADAANCGCTNGATSSPGIYCRTVELRLYHERLGSGPWKYAVEMRIPYRQRNVAAPTECEYMFVWWSGELSSDCSQHTGIGNVIPLNAGCTLRRATPCFPETRVVNESSATCTIKSPEDCFCDNCSETTQIDWAVTFSGATNNTCTDCADLAGTFLANSMVSNCRWVGKYPGEVTNCNGYTDVLVIADVDNAFVDLPMYYGTAADAICEDDWLTGAPSGVPTVAYSYSHTAGTACSVSSTTVTPNLSNFNLAGCSNTAILNSLTYSAS